LQVHLNLCYNGRAPSKGLAANEILALIGQAHSKNACNTTESVQ